MALTGVGGRLVEVEADVGRGLPGVSIVGLGDTALLQARDRIRAACTNTGLTWPSGKVVLSLSPASLPKQGSGFDLALVAGVLRASDVVPEERLAGTVLLGELALDGRVRPIRGVLPAVLAARDAGFGRVLVPVENLAEARLVDDVESGGVPTLADFAAWCRGTGGVVTEVPDPPRGGGDSGADLADVCGQEDCRQAIEVAAAGGHAVFLRGAPGTGKTMLARRLPGLLPDLDRAAALEVTAVHSVAGQLSASEPLLTRPPFVAPHHTASLPALVGGGNGIARPGAVSLAHRGVLFLDEAAEFAGRTLDGLRTPLEDGEVRIARRDGIAVFPARFQLVMAANPCPCGAGSPNSCTCSPDTRRRYAARLSGPLMDRVDISATTHPVGVGVLSVQRGEPTEAVRARVANARMAARSRWGAVPGAAGATVNATLPGAVLHGPVRLSATALRPLARALAHGVLSARGVDRCLRVAWTMADLAGAASPDAGHVAAAMVLRGEE